ncbi:MAG: 4Fe-4S binding protein [Streptosporangiaceae bacterium]
MTIGPCQGCGACLLTCPEHAIRPLGGTLAVLPGRCTGCGECIEVCPVDAIREDAAGEDGALLSVAGMRSGSWADPRTATGRGLR